MSSRSMDEDGVVWCDDCGFIVGDMSEMMGCRCEETRRDDPARMGTVMDLREDVARLTRERDEARIEAATWMAEAHREGAAKFTAIIEVERLWTVVEAAERLKAEGSGVESWWVYDHHACSYCGAMFGADGEIDHGDDCPALALDRAIDGLDGDDA